MTLDQFLDKAIDVLMDMGCYDPTDQLYLEHYYQSYSGKHKAMTDTVRQLFEAKREIYLAAIKKVLFYATEAPSESIIAAQRA